MSDTTDKWTAPANVDDVTLAFPARVVGALLPVRPDVPAEFRDNWHRSDQQWCHAAEQWMFNGIERADYVAKDGIDANKAWRHLAACMRSFEPSHEDKIAGVGWLMSRWFDKRAAVTP